MCRPDNITYFMNIASVVSQRSTCLRRKVGAVLVDTSKRIIATGYNGAPSGLMHCNVVGCLRDELKIPSGKDHQLCRALHAEQNALMQVSDRALIKGSTLYCTTSPCIICAKLLANFGVKHIYYFVKYDDQYAQMILDEAKIFVKKVDFDEEIN